MNFADAMRVMVEGKRVRLPEWFTGRTLRLEGDTLVQRSLGAEPRNMTLPSIQVALRTDWELAE